MPSTAGAAQGQERVNHVRVVMALERSAPSAAKITLTADSDCAKRAFVADQSDNGRYLLLADNGTGKSAHLRCSPYGLGAKRAAITACLVIFSSAGELSFTSASDSQQPVLVLCSCYTNSAVDTSLCDIAECSLFL
jgi:hypothetical protein